MKVLLFISLLVFSLQAKEIKTESIYFGMGCFWGAEKRFEELKGVVDAESGYANGDEKYTSYYKVLLLEKDIKKGLSKEKNHAEVVKVEYDPSIISTRDILIHFWENHDPTTLNRQGNDRGTNYRSAIYYSNDTQKKFALETKDEFQKLLTKAGYGTITTVIEKVYHYNLAEEYHQDYLTKKPYGYCGLQETGVKFNPSIKKESKDVYKNLNFDKQLIVFESDNCPFCELFKRDILDNWQSPVNVVSTKQIKPPKGWKLEKALFATPTIVLFEKGKEVSRYTGYQGERNNFWKWLGFEILSDEQKKIAFENGTERRFSSFLDEKRKGTFVDPITGAPLFRSDTKFESGTGWPSFFNPVKGSITEHIDKSHGMMRIEIKSASSGIHLGHVFNDGPPPTYKRYCINGKVLKFIPDEE
jgi:peptide methionine sulfoxide reductase msrA/msrB